MYFHTSLRLPSVSRLHPPSPACAPVKLRPFLSPLSLTSSHLFSISFFVTPSVNCQNALPISIWCELKSGYLPSHASSASFAKRLRESLCVSASTHTHPLREVLLISLLLLPLMTPVSECAISSRTLSVLCPPLVLPSHALSSSTRQHTQNIVNPRVPHTQTVCRHAFITQQPALSESAPHPFLFPTCLFLFFFLFLFLFLLHLILFLFPLCLFLFPLCLCLCLYLCLCLPLPASASASALSSSSDFPLSLFLFPVVIAGKLAHISCTQ